MTNQGGQSFADFSGSSSGAKFYRADLHVHSYGGSSDVADTTMTPEAIIRVAKERGIRLVAIADHNVVTNVSSLLEAAAATAGDVVAIPGVEVTTSQGHVLVYCAPEKLNDLDTWLKTLQFQPDEQGGKYTRKPIDVIAKEASDLGAVAIPAHVGRSGTGFLGKAPHRECQAIFESPYVLSMEVDSDHVKWFTATDSGEGAQNRGDYLKKRADAIGSVRLGRVLFSDAHTLERVGRTPNGKERLTRIKMEIPSFEGLKAALLDPDARVVLEDPLPEIYPRIVGIRFIGGFLDTEEIAFAPNLTALIGGRGTGKSTAIEALRCTCTGATSEISKSSAWPNSVQIEYLDALGVRHLAQRDAETGVTYEVIAGEATPITIPLEGYPQDHIAEIVRGCDSNPGLLQEFFDQYLRDPEGNETLERLSTQLRENADLVVPLDDASTELAAAKKRLLAVTAQIKVAATTKAREALEYRRALNSERDLRSAVRSELDDMRESIRVLSIKVDLDALAQQAGISDISETSAKKLVAGVGAKDGEHNLNDLLLLLNTDLADWRSQGLELFNKRREGIDGVLSAWDERDKQIEARIQAIVEKLRLEGVPTDLKELNALAKNETDARRKVAEHTKRETERKRLLKERTRLLEAYRKAQERRTALRVQLGKQLSRQFEEAGVEFRVTVKYRNETLVDEYEAWLRRRISNRFLRGDRVAQFCRAIHPIDLAGDARASTVARLLSLKDTKRTAFFAKTEDAQEFVGVIKDDVRELYNLETLTRGDRPEITLTTSNQEGKPLSVAFVNLSFGQKASILLGALLFSDRRDPLVIDQPEDHLDSAFIYEAVVHTLRRVKERRQVILATHNANIAVLGDAELIVPLRSWAGKGMITDRGSVDTATTRDRACKILEGGEQAYRRRGEMYGLR